MSQLSIITMSMKPQDAQQKARQHAEKVADQFEQIFTRTMVSSLRSSGSCGGEGGMFGSGPGADTYADWFDQNLAEQLGKNGDIGIRKALMADLEHAGEVQLQKKIGKGEQSLDLAMQAADRSALRAAGQRKGGIDVLQ
jgi:Rod binding domain-containing protein